MRTHTGDIDTQCQPSFQNTHTHLAFFVSSFLGPFQRDINLSIFHAFYGIKENETPLFIWVKKNIYILFCIIMMCHLYAGYFHRKPALGPRIAPKSQFMRPADSVQCARLDGVPRFLVPMPEFARFARIMIIIHYCDANAFHLRTMW